MKRLLALLFVVIFGFPLVWMLVSSLKSGYEVVGQPWSVPHSPQWVNFAHAWSEAGIGASFLNSVIVCLLSLAVLLPAGAMAAYVLSKVEFPGRKLIHTAFMGGMMFPHFLVVVPLFFLLRGLHLFDSRTGLILVYIAYSLPFTVFVLGGFFDALPNDLAEAARLDGCTDAGTFWRVMVPLVRPGLIVAAIFNGIGLWNEYGLALVLIPGQANRTLPLGIANLTMTQQYQSDWGALFAGLVIVTAPVLLIYWLLKERIIEAMLAGAIK